MQPARKRRGTVTGCSRALVVNLLPKMHATSFRQVRSRGPLSRDVVSRVHPLSAFSETVDATSIDRSEDEGKEGEIVPRNGDPIGQG